MGADLDSNAAACGPVDLGFGHFFAGENELPEDLRLVHQVLLRRDGLQQPLADDQNELSIAPGLRVLAHIDANDGKH